MAQRHAPLAGLFVLGAALLGCVSETSELDLDPDRLSDPGEAIGESRTGRFAIDGEAVSLRYRAIGAHRTFETDIVLDDEVELPEGPEAEPGVAVEPLFAVSRSSRLWPHAVVPYTIDRSVSTPSRVRSALRVWEATGIRFVPRTTQRAYVTFREEDGNGVCRAQVGYNGGRRYVYLRDTSRSTACSLGVMVHETGHVLGLWHEHTRPDRDRYVRIVWSHVPSAHRDAFEIMTSGARRVGAYDITSSMHYRSYTLTSDGGASVTRRDGRTLLHDWATISRGDVAAIRALYFDGTPVPGTTSPRDAGPPDAGPRDAGALDAGPRDAGSDAWQGSDAGPHELPPIEAHDGSALGGDGGDAGLDPDEAELGDPSDDGMAGDDLAETDRSLHGTCSASPTRATRSISALVGMAGVGGLFARRRRRGSGRDDSRRPTGRA